MLSESDERFSEWLDLRAAFVKWQKWFGDDHTSEKERDNYDNHEGTKQLVGLMKDDIVCGVRWTSLSPDEVNTESMLTLSIMSSIPLSKDKKVEELLAGKTDHLKRWRDEAEKDRLIDVTRFAVRYIDSNLPHGNRRRIVRRQKIHYARLVGTMVRMLMQDNPDGGTIVFATSPSFENFLASLIKIKVIARDDTTVFIETDLVDIRESFKLNIGRKSLANTIGTVEAIRTYGGFRKMAADKRALHRKTTTSNEIGNRVK